MLKILTKLFFENGIQNVESGLYKTNRSVWLFFASIFAIAVLFQVKIHFYYPWDLLVDYLPLADELANNQSKLYPFGELWSKRLVFVWMLSMLLKIFKGSELVFQIIPIFIGFIGTFFITSVGALTYRFGGKFAALITFSLMLISSTVMDWAPRHLDALWPTFLLFCLFCLFDPKQKRYPFVLGMGCGVLGLLALLSKETAILFFPVTLIFWLIGIVPQSSKRLAGYHLIYCMGLVLWFFYFQGGPKYQTPSHIIPLDTVTGCIGFAVTGIWKYYNFLNGKIFTWYPFAFFFVLLPFFCCVKLIQTIRISTVNKMEKMSVLMIICFLPFDVIVGAKGFRPSQNFISPALMFLITGCALSNFFSYIERYIRLRKEDLVLFRIPFSKFFYSKIRVPLFLLFVFCMVILSLNFENQRNFNRSFSNTIANNLQLGMKTGKSFSFYMPGFDLGKELLRLNSNKHEQRIIIDSIVHVKGANLVFSNAKKKKIKAEYLPVFALVDHEKFYRRNRFKLDQKLSGNIFIRQTNLNDVLEIISFQKILEYVVEKNVGYLVFSEDFHHIPILEQWIKKYARYKSAVVDGEKYKIYRVKLNKCKKHYANIKSFQNGSVFLTNSLVRKIQNLVRDDPKLWKSYSEQLIGYIPAITQKNIKNIISGDVKKPIIILDQELYCLRKMLRDRGVGQDKLKLLGMRYREIDNDRVLDILNILGIDSGVIGNEEIQKILEFLNI